MNSIISSMQRSTPLVLLFALMSIMCTRALAQTAKRQIFKRATIGSVEIVPPKGSKAGSIGGFPVATLLHQSDVAVLGLTGKSANGSELEFLVFSAEMDKVRKAWISGWTLQEAKDLEWQVLQGGRKACLVTASRYWEPEGEYDPGSAWAGGYFVYEGMQPQSLELANADGLYRHDIECSRQHPGEKLYNAKLRAGAPYYSHQSSMPDIDYGIGSIIAMGTGRIVKLDQTYTKIRVEGCNLVGMICYSVDSDTKEETPSYSECNDAYLQRYYLIDPETGTSQLMK